MCNSNGTQDSIRRFIIKQFPLAKQLKAPDEDSLLENGIVDSVGILDIVNFIMDEFNIEIADEELQPENFESIKSLSEFVKQKQVAIN